MSADKEGNRAAIPMKSPDVCGDGRWQSLHERFISEAKENEPKVVFIGDLIIANLSIHEMWDRLFVPMNSLNFGIEGCERTEHVLWRVINGEMEHMHLKAVVLHVGTSNHGCSAEQITEGIMEIVDATIKHQPDAQIIVLKLLPRGEKPNATRDRNTKVNELLSQKLVSKPQTHLLNIDPGFVQHDGTITHHDMWDYLHLSKSGYTKAFQPVHDLLRKIIVAEEDGKLMQIGNMEELAIK